MKLTNANQVQSLAMERREKYAAELFQYDKVMGQIITLASKGLGHLRIAQELPASLRNMKAASQLVNKLKEAGYSVEWVDAVEREKCNGAETGGFILYQELRITWVETRIHSGPQAMPAD